MRMALVLVLAAFALACGPKNTLDVRKVLVDVEPSARGVDREEVRAVVTDVLGKARGLRLVDAGGAGGVLRVRVEAYAGAGAEGGSGQGEKQTLALTVELTSVPGDELAGGYRGHAIASGAGIIERKVLVGQALRDALAQVLMTRNAADLKSEELIAWLEDDNANDEQKRRAVRILGSRRERAAVEALSKILVGGNEELEPLALAALTNIGDPGAVDAVIAYSDRQPPVVKKQCIEAVRSMGSPRGRAWLFTLSTGHPDADVQQQAAAALAALEGGEPGTGAVAEKASEPSDTATR